MLMTKMLLRELLNFCGPQCNQELFIIACMWIITVHNYCTRLFGMCRIFQFVECFVLLFKTPCYILITSFLCYLFLHLPNSIMIVIDYYYYH